MDKSDGEKIGREAAETFRKEFRKNIAKRNWKLIEDISDEAYELLSKKDAEITRLKEEREEEKEFKQRQLEVLENNRRELISNYEEELGRYKAALSEAMEWNWLDDDAPDRFDVDNPPEVETHDNKQG